ncbi:Bax inhibitor-1 family protein [Gammaproteobacteria bacterium]|nr:Bax inhibitor-1 family protein [Gammaproteobacteria bacterium]
MSYTVNTTTYQSHLATNKVLRNTYALLGLTILFSAFCAWASLVMRLPHPGLLPMLAGFYGLSYLTTRYSDRALGLVFAFLFTGFLGYTTGPLIGMVLQSTANGYAILSLSLFMTGLTFLSLSAYVLTTNQDMSYLGGSLFILSVVGIVMAFLSIFLQIPMLYAAVSGLFALISSGFILFHTSEIIHGGERNYIVATISLFVAIYNLFLSLLRIFMMFAGQRD